MNGILLKVVGMLLLPLYYYVRMLGRKRFSTTIELYRYETHYMHNAYIHIHTHYSKITTVGISD